MFIVIHAAPIVISFNRGDYLLVMPALAADPRIGDMLAVVRPFPAEYNGSGGSARGVHCPMTWRYEVLEQEEA